MPVEIATNTLSALGSLALLLNPPAEHQHAQIGSNAAPSVVPETVLGDWGGARTAASDRGVDFTVQYLGEVVGNVTGGARQGTVYNGLLQLAGTADLAKSVGWPGAEFQVTLLYPHGRSLTDKFVNDLFVLSNLDASDDLHLFELWLEQNFADDRFSVRLGQMAVDQEFAFTEQGALFNNSAFGWFPIVGATAPVYPQGAPGVRLKWQPSAATYIQFAAVDGDVNPPDGAGKDTNPHGVEFRFNEGAFLIAETGYNWALANETKPGTLKLGAWYHTADAAHVRLDDTGLSLADPLSSGTPASLSDNWGIYLGAEQVLWKEDPAAAESSQGLGIFGRCGYAPSDRNTLGVYLEGGVTRTGLLPGRDADVCGIGIAYGQLSHSLRDLGADGNFFNATSAPLPDYELVIEAEYQIQCAAGCVIQPGFQYIVHPGGSRAIADALVLNLRTILEF